MQSFFIFLEMSQELRVVLFSRVLLMLERYRKAVSPLPVRIVSGDVCNRISGLSSNPSERLCLQFIKEDVYYLVSFSCYIFRFVFTNWSRNSTVVSKLL